MAGDVELDEAALQGVFRRGLQLEALKEFILSQGASKNVTLQEWEKLWSTNKRIIDPVCPRSVSHHPKPLRLLRGGCSRAMQGLLRAVNLTHPPQ